MRIVKQIFVYCVGSRIKTRYYSSTVTMFRDYSEFTLANRFGKVAQCEFHLTEAFALQGEQNDTYYFEAFDCFGRFLTSDTLVGLYREHKKYRHLAKTFIKKRKSRKRGAWGNYRNVRTIQERRHFYNDYDDIEYNVRLKLRAGRNARNLPSNWDDIISHNDKCWKTQRKTKHQYK